MTIPGGSTNIVLGDNCANLQNVSVNVVVTEELIAATTPAGGGLPTPNGGFSVQFNAFPAPGSTYQGQTLGLIQNIITVTDSQVTNVMNATPVWAIDSPFPEVSSGSSGSVIGSAPANQIPSGAIFSFGASDESGDFGQWAQYHPPQGYGEQIGGYGPRPWHISGFEVNIVGPGGGATATFSSGSGYLQYYAEDASGSPIALTPQAGGPGSACGQYPVVITDQSNIVYGPMTASASPGTSAPFLQQNFGLAVPATPNPAFYATFMGTNDALGTNGAVELYLTNNGDYPLTCYATLSDVPPGEAGQMVIELAPNNAGAPLFESMVSWAVPQGTYDGTVYCEYQGTNDVVGTVNCPGIKVPGALPYGPPPPRPHHIPKPTPPGWPG